ncbi:flagellar motor protein MotB [Planococcus lenghuensis]|uniref:Flagellar motor protein MotB n=2 Tax=Planococcus lenghuensis TaxID=2213202 RepID=A0A1Q2KVW1_9BACL|nr:flagellar motor protein MotB [Planococcus lenghuensis]
MRRGRRRKEINYWMSYSDLMSAMLMVFALVLTTVILEYKEDIEEKQRQIDEVTTLKADIIAALMEEFKDSNMNIEVDPQTGAIRFPGNILYEYDSTELSEEGVAFLRNFVPKYFGIILQERFKDDIASIIVEGHTDKEGSYLYNLNLSQQRSFSVVEEIYQEGFPDFEQKEISKEILTSNGRSYTVPVENEDGTYSAEKSRRVEFLFRLKEDERIEAIQKLVTDE